MLVFSGIRFEHFHEEFVLLHCGKKLSRISSINVKYQISSFNDSTGETLEII